MTQELVLDAASASPHAVAAVLRDNGCVLLRNALPRKPLLRAGEAVHANARRLNDVVGREVNDMPFCFSDLACDDPDVVGLDSNSLAGFTDPLTLAGFDESWFSEGKRNFRRWFWDNGALFPNAVLGLIVRSQLPAVYEALYEEPVACSYAHCAVRYQRNDIRHKGFAFHQDASFHSRDRSGHSGLTTWIPLSDCGVDAPGLQLYPKALEEILPLPEGVEAPYLFSDTKMVLERYGDQLWAPELSAGDVLVFNHFVVHRSHVTDTMTRERQSADFRVFPRSRIPGYVRDDGGWLFEIPFAPAAVPDR